MSEMLEEFRKAHENEWTRVKFTKTDGSIRVMDLVPKSQFGVYAPQKQQGSEPPGSKSGIKRKKAEGVITVLEKDVGWRSFRENSLIEFTIVQ